LGVDEIADVDAVDRDVAEVTGDAHVDQPAVPDRDAGQVAVGEPGAAQVRHVEPGAPELLAAAALAAGEPVRSELRRHGISRTGLSASRRNAAWISINCAAISLPLMWLAVGNGSTVCGLPAAKRAADRRNVCTG